MTTPTDKDLRALAEALSGKYRVPITDGLGATGGGDEPDNPDEFVRTFKTPPIQKEASAAIIGLLDRIEALETLWFQPCSGCYEPGEYCQNEADYPWSEKHHCRQGGGCDECGGTGVAKMTGPSEIEARAIMRADTLKAELSATRSQLEEAEKRLETRLLEAEREVIERVRTGEVIEDTVRAIEEAFSDVAKDPALRKVANRYAANIILARLEESLLRRAKAGETDA